MSFILMLLGLAGAAFGLIMVGFGIPINEFSLGNTLIIAGTTAFVGGLILVALALVLRQLNHLAMLLSVRPGIGAGAGKPDGRQVERQVGRQVETPFGVPEALSEPVLRAADPRGKAPSKSPKPAKRAPDQAPLPMSLPERVDMPMPRASEPGFPPSFESFPPEPSFQDREPRPVVAPAPFDEPVFAPPPPPSAAETPEVPSWLPSRRDSKKPARKETSFERDFAAGTENNWQPEKRVPPSRPDMDMAAQSSAAPPPASPVEFPSAADIAPTVETPPPAPQRSEPVSVLKSGVVDGMAYTLYTDGSIEAELADGVVRFGSIEELRNHLEKSAS